MKQTTLKLSPESIGSLNPIWHYGANTCHAPLWFRDDLLRHLEICRDQLGFTRVRAHGTVGDGMETVRPNGEFSFERVVSSLRRLLDAGYTPFLEISHMPGALAANDNTICRYRFRSSPPRDWGQWGALIEAMIQALIKAFGHQELRRWDFEVWNEPDISFWTGTQEEYFRLYDIAAAAIKKADGQFRVGGPATARCKWIKEFFQHLDKPSADYPLDERTASRCDFISTHAYPSDLEFLDSDQGEVTLQASGVMRQLFADARNIINQYRNPSFPMICGEWNSSAGPLVENHDHCNNAAFVCKTMAELSDPFGENGAAGICQGSLFWNLSDIYEECGFHYEPFHGGYGLLTVNDVPKSSFRAFELLRRHRGQRIATSLSPVSQTGLGSMATTENHQTLITLWHLAEPTDDNQPVSVSIPAPENAKASRRSILPGHGSAYEKWLEMGSPQYPNRAILETLHEASVCEESSLTADAEGCCFRLTVEPGTVHQVEIVTP